MPKKGHTEEQIITALKQHESGEKTTEICRKLTISQAAFYLWKKQYAGLGVQGQQGTDGVNTSEDITVGLHKLI